MNQSILHSFRMSVQEQALGVYGVHVFKKGEGTVEHRFRNDDTVNLYSASKTFTSVGVGICRDEGGLQLTDTALSFFPEYAGAASPGSEAITLIDLLHMASGKEVFWFTPQQNRSMDIAETFFREPMTRQPGEKFFYSNLCTYMLGRVVEKVSGQILREYLVDRLFDPLGIELPQWNICPGGHTIAASGLFMTTSELAKLGQLLLQKGEYEGKQLVAADYIDAMQADIVPTAHWTEDTEGAVGYGYQVWRCTAPGTYRADGMYGQFSIVLPDQEAVVTLTSHNETCTNNSIRAVFRDIVPLL